MTILREKIIQTYIEGYNEFDVNKMIENFDDAIVFQDILNDEITTTLKGLEAFKRQANLAKSFFSSRTQEIKSFKHLNDETQIEIDYLAFPAVDLSSELKKGKVSRLQGKSIFKFRGTRIVELTDIS